MSFEYELLLYLELNPTDLLTDLEIFGIILDFLFPYSD
jgi:Na+/H+ antiporter NhaC